MHDLTDLLKAMAEAGLTGQLQVNATKSVTIAYEGKRTTMIAGDSLRLGIGETPQYTSEDLERWANHAKGVMTK